MFSIQKLSYHYPSKSSGVLSDFHIDFENLHFSPNEIVALIGANGCGKSTFYRLLSGVLSSDDMTINYKGEQYSSLLDTDLKIGFHNAFAPLIETLSVRDNLRFFARLYGVNDIPIAINTVAFKYGINELLDKTPDRLSQGQQHRAKLARTMLHDPDIIILDEPSTASDIKQIESILASIATLKKQGKLIFFSTHHLYELTRLKPRLVGMKNGHIVFDTPWASKFDAGDELSETMLELLGESHERV